MTTLSIQLPQWQAKRRRRFLQLSASQMETFDLCGRKWWNARVYGLDVEESSHGQVVGTVMHSVIERYLLADHLGRDAKTGYPVELYPVGWHLARNRYNPSVIDGEAFPEDQDKIKRLFDEAVGKGVIVRTPETMIEHEFRLELLSLPCGYCTGGSGLDPHDGSGKDCEGCGGDGKGDHLQMVGFIDVLNAEGVQDHKTTSKMKYAKSAKDLTENIQMMSYAKLHMRVYPNNPTKKIKLRHNVFCLDPKDLRVRKTDAEVSWEQVEDFWQNKILRIAREMAHWRRAANHWTHIPDPARSKNACNAYGGCPFQTICGGKETVEMFEARHSLTCSVVSETPALGVEVIPENSGENAMSQITPSPSFPTSFAGAPVGAPVHPGAQAHFNQMPGPAPVPQAPGMGFTSAPPMGVPAGAPVMNFPAPGSTAPIAGPVEPFALPATMIANLPHGQRQPPWAVAGCGACGGFGFNTQGHPCQICDTVQRSLNKPTSSMFVQTVPGNGTLAWEPKQGVMAAAGQAQTQTAQQPIKTEERQAPVIAQNGNYQLVDASALASAPTPQSPEQPAPTQQAAADAKGGKAKGPKGGVGRPKKSFVLCIARSEAAGVVYGEEDYGSGRGVYTLGQVLNNIGPEMAKAMGKENFLDIPVFDRRDMITRNAAKIVETFGTDWVIASGLGEGQSDLRTLLDAIRPFAGMVFVA